MQLYFLDPTYVNFQICDYSPVPAANVFHHLAGTFRQIDSTHVELKLYIDGTCVKTVTKPGNLANCQNDVPVTIGASVEGGEYLVGVIDEASIYNRALGPAEIARIYSAGTAGKCLDSDADGLPDWWEIEHFGSLEQTADGDYDQDGVSNWLEYMDGTDPNNISFSVVYDALFTRSSSVGGTIQVATGVPSYMAASVNGTALFGGAWVPFTPSLTIPLAGPDGTNDVRVGLKGRAADSTATWEFGQIVKDTTAPLIIITNPVSSATTQPLLQIQGYSPEPLSAISYDISNSAVQLTAVEAFVSDRFFDTNIFGFTTNFFSLLDIDLVNGVNRIVIHATDLAGNITLVTNDCTLNSDSVPPVLGIVYPQNGMHICGDSFSVEGTVDDVTAALALALADDTGVTNYFTGVAERNGRFWIEELPLASSVNYLAITATDVWGNTTSTNLNITKSAVTLLMNDPMPDSLHDTAILASGWIDDGSYVVRVNGILADNNGGAWTAYDVPVRAGGVATFSVVAYPPGHDLDPAAAVQVQTNPEKPPRLFMQRHVRVSTVQTHMHYDSYVDLDGPIDDTADSNDCITQGHVWVDGEGGNGWWLREATGTTLHDPPTGVHCNCLVDYPPAAYPNPLPGTPVINPECAEPRGPEWIPGMPFRFVNWGYGTTQAVTKLYVPSQQKWYTGSNTVQVITNDIPVLMLYTGGKALVHRQNLFRIHAEAQNENFVPYEPTGIEIGELGKLGSDGNLYKALADGETRLVSPTIEQQKFYTFTIDPKKYTLWITANGVDIESRTPEHCVGELAQLDATWIPALAEGTQHVRWLIYLDCFTGLFAREGEASPLYWFDVERLKEANTEVWWNEAGEGKPVWCKVTNEFSNGQTLVIERSGQVTVRKPTIEGFTSSCGGVHFLNPNQGGNQELALMDSAGNGMSWTVILKRPEHFSGQAWHTQLVKRDWWYDSILGDTSETTGGDYWLDNSEPYRGKVVLPASGSPQRPVALPSDEPGLERASFYSIVEQKDDFRTYLRFQPDTPGSIPVTIGRIDWGWHGGAQMNPQSGVWSLSISNYYGPTGDWSDRSPASWLRIYRNN